MNAKMASRWDLSTGVPSPSPMNHCLTLVSQSHSEDTHTTDNHQLESQRTARAQGSCARAVVAAVAVVAVVAWCIELIRRYIILCLSVGAGSW